ncbi:recombinase family protein [Aeromonas veronii]
MMQITKMSAYVYGRISSKHQKEGSGLQRQITNALSYCKANGFNVLDISQDVASAYHARHLDGPLGVFLQAIKDGHIVVPSALVVESLDRLGRDHELQALSRFIDIVQSGVQIHELSTGIIYNNTDMHLLHVALSIMSRAHNESLLKSKRSKDGIERRIQAARQNNAIITHITPVWVDVVDGQLVLNKHADTVKKIIDMYLSGMTFRPIARALRDQKIPYPTAKAAKSMTSVDWGFERVATILKSPALYGCRVIKNQDPIYDYYPKIIDESLYYHIQDIIKSRRVNKPKINELLSIASGLCKCKHCGHSYVATTRSWSNANGVERSIALRCNGRLSAKKCHNRSIPMHVVEQLLLDVVPQINVDRLNKPQSNTLKTMQMAASMVERKMSNLIDLVSDGSEVAKAKFNELRAEHDRLTSQIDTIKSKIINDQKPHMTSKVLDTDNIGLRRQINTSLALMGASIELYSTEPYHATMRVCIKDNEVFNGEVKWSRKKRIDSHNE